MRRLVPFLIGALSLCAQTPTSTGVQLSELKEVQITPRVGILGEAKITLAEVIERVLRADRDLAISRIQREEAQNNIRAARGAYDPLVGMRLYHLKAVSPVASTLSGSATGGLTSTEWNGTPRIAGLTPTGGSYNLSFTNSRQTSDNLFISLNPLYQTTLSLNLTQPLWRGLRIDETRERIQVARKNNEMSREQLRQSVIEAVTMAVQAYWELAYAWQSYQVQSEAVRLAERQYGSNRRLAEQGVLAPVDVVAAQTQVATFQQALFGAQQALTAAENQLKQLMLANREDLMWSTALVPENAPEIEAKLPSLQEAIGQALKARPELKQTSLAYEISRIAVRLAHDETKPKVDAFANFSLTGLAGIPVPPTANPITTAFYPVLNTLNQLAVIAGLPPITNINFGGGSLPSQFIGSYGQSISGLWSAKYPVAQVGVDISLPIRNRTAQAVAQNAEADARKAKAQREQVEMMVEADVRNSLQAANSARARLEAAVVARRSAEEQYASEQRQFQAGTSTVFLVLQRQTDLIAARSREVRARSDFAEAAAGLDRAMSTTIAVHHIEVTN